MARLVLAVAFLVAIHVVPSAPGIRERLVMTLGKAGFYAGYSLLSLAALTAVIWAYQTMQPGPWLYESVPGARWSALVGMAIACFLLAARLTTAPAEETPHGIYRVTAVPGSLAFLIWALVHLANLGEARLVVIFIGMAVLAAAALIKNLHRASPSYRNVGWLPFAAIIAGRQTLVWSEIAWWRLALALGLYLGLLLLHPLVIGPDPLAG